jgi:hypothetical protein
MSQVKFFKVYRPPLDMPQGPMMHFGIAAVDQQTGQTWVLHNTPARGEHVCSMPEFAAGLSWKYEAVQDNPQTRERFIAVANNPKVYDLLANNCQHTANRVADGWAWSPGLWLVGIGVGIGICLLLTNGGRGAARA